MGLVRSFAYPSEVSLSVFRVCWLTACRCRWVSLCGCRLVVAGSVRVLWCLSCGLGQVLVLAMCPSGCVGGILAWYTGLGGLGQLVRWLLGPCEATIDPCCVLGLASRIPVIVPVCWC